MNLKQKFAEAFLGDIIKAKIAEAAPSSNRDADDYSDVDAHWHSYGNPDSDAHT